MSLYVEESSGSPCFRGQRKAWDVAVPGVQTALTEEGELPSLVRWGRGGRGGRVNAAMPYDAMIPLQKH